MASKLIYIHGFNSSELSQKAVQLGEYLATWSGQYLVPRLSHDPKTAIAQLEQHLDQDTALIGSSLGGFFATYLSQTHGLPAVVVNPAVHPARRFSEYLGPQYNPYQDYHYQLDKTHLQALDELYLEQLTSPELLFLLQQQGDEVLPYRQAVDYYQACQQVVEPGGEHRFVGFERYFGAITRFLNITLTT
ncbi:YqiA/YcfP family alpha/beta fold hydrolase [Pseudoalteromonas sp. T1lg88]|uniref:YqiA/YcfP family alpha/beta fold hydrolase n=1 Tax=Pseudoalteromonas sp. T1lg88 TaxID=2077104 RepID=UPI000CF5F824|nr:YqiA/YcfP family alpha/beta fold hydrolase [Pseudoalteromonas sp. T1lg88]